MKCSILAFPTNNSCLVTLYDRISKTRQMELLSTQNVFFYETFSIFKHRVCTVYRKWFCLRVNFCSCNLVDWFLDIFSLLGTPYFNLVFATSSKHLLIKIRWKLNFPFLNFSMRRKWIYWKTWFGQLYCVLYFVPYLDWLSFWQFFQFFKKSQKILGCLKIKGKKFWLQDQIPWKVC